ncbi:(R)-specific enoyl-CoA hydratase-like [Oppia nitens]|uniref:(R)-specific enoyl-CoA hydratase-like n=1 Tax=Oppia nitens TaxID=1686743 RepID=UPI0023D99B46|nr:(R)-specific enoyl-CoA hydratase-like [Oppia nitens]
MNCKLFFANYLSKSLLFGNIHNNNYWLVRRLGSLSVGQSAQLSKVFTEADVCEFGKLTGDYNPIHFDYKYCSKTKFCKPVVHGSLTNGLVGAVMGTLLPGPGTVVVQQTINYTKPLYIGEEVCAEVIVTDIKKKFIDCRFSCKTNDGKTVIEGTAKLIMFS